MLNRTVVVHSAIYDRKYGIQTVSNLVVDKARRDLYTADTYLSRKGAQAIILGCTEIPLALTEKQIENRIIVDTTFILASAPIRELRNEQLP